jgi:hypothetical protein
MSAFYDQASLVVVPSGYKSGKIYAQKPLTTDGQLTFTRASNATRVASNGLIEKVRTNLVLQSNTFNTTWASAGTGGAIVTSGQADPDGGTSAWLLAKGGVTGRIEQNITMAANEQTFSIIAKKGTANFLYVVVFDGTGGHTSFFNLDTGVVGTQANAVGSIVSLGSGWYRCSVTSTNLNAAGVIQIYISDSDASVTGTSGNIYIYQSQFENGVATDYIATTTTAVSVGPVSGLPRLDYLNSSCPRLLLEPQRTNAATFSEQFNNAAWTLSRTSAFGSGSVANAVTSPDGYTNAEYIQQASGQTESGGCFQSISYTSGTTYTLSVFAKQGENRYARIGFGIGTAGAAIFCGFDLQEGIAGTPDSGISSVSIVDYGSGWYRCSITATSQVTLSRGTFVYQSSNLNSTTTTPLQGIYVWGAQLEVGAYATSYIPTLSTSVTRVADAASKENIAGTLPTGYPFTLYAQGFLRENDDVLISINDVSVFSIFYQIGATANGFFANARNITTSLISTTSGRNVGTHKVAAVFTSSEIRLFANGALIASGANAQTFNASANDLLLGQLRVNSDIGQRSSVNQALVFKSALTDAQCIELTA